MNIVVVGGGTAGIIAATYIKKYWKESIRVSLVYDHSKPGIGVGESLTPAIYKYLNFIGVTRDDLVKNVNATVKLGLKFKNWLGDGKSYYHNFAQYEDEYYNLIAAYDIAYDRYANDTTYDSFYMEHCVIPRDPNAQQSLHIDATLFSKYIESRFKNDINIIDDIVSSVVVKDNKINKLILKNSGELSGDLFIDATGFQSILMKELDNTWVDKKDWMPIDSCIPNPVVTDFIKQPCCTTSEASEDGWILQVPLSNRWGAGYLYSSNFTSDDVAFNKFSKFVENTYDKKLSNTDKILRFNSGYWKNQWVGNCIVVGLASGFSEPLEATNIHHTVEQVDQFVNLCSLQYCDYDVKNYNKFMEEFYENVYLYLRFCYTTGRTDSEFWRYMTANVPQSVKDLEEKVSYDFLTFYDLLGPIFSFGNFTRVAVGLGKVNRNSIKSILEKRGLTAKAKHLSDQLRYQKSIDIKNVIDHRAYINVIKGIKQ